MATDERVSELEAQKTALESTVHELEATVADLKAKSDALEDKLEQLRSERELESAQSKKQVEDAVRVAMEHKERFAQMKMKLNTAVAENDKLEEKLEAQADEMEHLKQGNARKIETLQTQIEKLTAENKRLMQGSPGQYSLLQELREMKAVNQAMIATLDKEALNESLREQNEIIERIAAIRPPTVEFGCQVSLDEDSVSRVQELQFENRKLKNVCHDQTLVIEGYEKSHKLTKERIEELEAEIMRVTSELNEKTGNGALSPDMESLVKENSILLGSLSKSTELVGKLQMAVVKWKRRAKRELQTDCVMDLMLTTERIKTMNAFEKLKRQALKPASLSEPQLEINSLRTANSEMRRELETVRSELDTLRGSCHELAEKCQSYESVVQDSIARVQRLQQDNESLVVAFKRLMEENKAIMEGNQK